MAASLITLKPFLLLVLAIPTGLVVRAVGQYILDWSDEPIKKKKESVEKQRLLNELKATLANASQYCEQMIDGLSAIRHNPDNFMDRAQNALAMNIRSVVIPTYNFDVSVIERLSGQFSLITENKELLDQLSIIRLEILHAHRRINVVADKLLFLSIEELTSNVVYSHYLQGVTALLHSTLTQCRMAQSLLETGVESSMPTDGKWEQNYRRGVVFAATVILVILLYWVARLPETPKQENDNTKPVQGTILS